MMNVLMDKFGEKLVYVEETDSTNSLAKRESYKPHKTVFIAKRQTAGRGRSGKVWNSESEDSLYMSILLKPEIPIHQVPHLTLVFGLAACNALKKYANIGIKWPNDIILNRKKLSGILCESAMKEGKVEYVVLGIGVNVNNEVFPKEIEDIATSLKKEVDKNFSISKIAEEIINEFYCLYDEFIENGLENILNDYKNNCLTLLKYVIVKKNNESIKAFALDITNDGGLLVKNEDKEFVIDSGEASIRGINGFKYE